MIAQKISGNATQRLPPDHPSLKCTAETSKHCPVDLTPQPPGSSEMICLNTASNEPSLLSNCCVSFVSFVCLHPSMLNECCFICTFPFESLLLVANPWHHYSLLLFHCSFFFLRAQGNSIWPFTQPCFRNIGLEASFSWKMEKGAMFLLREFGGPRGKK